MKLEYAAAAPLGAEDYPTHGILCLQVDTTIATLDSCGLSAHYLTHGILWQLLAAVLIYNSNHKILHLAQAAVGKCNPMLNVDIKIKLFVRNLTIELEGGKFFHLSEMWMICRIHTHT